MKRPCSDLQTLVGAVLLGLSATALHAEQNPPPRVLPNVTYADLADLADSAPLVVRAQIRSLAPLDLARARAVAPGKGRFYVEARTEALIAGTIALGEQLRFLVDLPVDARGKPPKLKKRSVIVFARPVANRPAELQLVAPDAMIQWDAETDVRLRPILSGLLGSSPPPRVSGLREAIFVPGNLAGEGETQLFLETPGGEPAAITVLHRPGQRPSWSASFSELLNTNAPPPRRDTLEWYRLACFLPQRLPASANVSANPAERNQAAEDYALVRADLGECLRNRH
jgi:hypothetical protein